VPARLRLVLIALTVCAAAAVIGASLAMSGDDGGTGQTNGWAGAVRPPGAKVPEFRLTDQDGKTVTAASLKGKPTVYAFIYSTCQDTCPLTAQQIRGALDDLSGDERKGVRAFALSVDPANDTADSARRFLVGRRVSGYLDFLIGPRSDLQPIWRDYGFAPQTSEREHNSYVVLIDKSGRQRVGFPIDYLTPEDLAHDIRLLLRGT